MAAWLLLIAYNCKQCWCSKLYIHHFIWVQIKCQEGLQNHRVNSFVIWYLLSNCPLVGLHLRSHRRNVYPQRLPTEWVVKPLWLFFFFCQSDGLKKVIYECTILLMCIFPQIVFISCVVSFKTWLFGTFYKFARLLTFCLWYELPVLFLSLSFPSSFCLAWTLDDHVDTSLFF